MQRSELEHIIRACGEIAGDEEIVIIGSQSILGQFPNAPVRLLASMEADVYPGHNPDLADKVDGAIGEGSSFHALNGYYAQGVGPETAELPGGWKDRLVVVKNENTNGIAGLCLEVHDLAVSKLIAARPKDFEFVQELILHKMIQKITMLARIAEPGLRDSARSRVHSKIEAMFSN